VLEGEKRGKRGGGERALFPALKKKGVFVEETWVEGGGKKREHVKGISRKKKESKIDYRTSLEGSGGEGDIRAVLCSGH